MTEPQLNSPAEPPFKFAAIACFKEGMALSEGHKWEIHKALLIASLVIIPVLLIFNVLPSYLQTRFPDMGILGLVSLLGQFAYIFIMLPINAGFVLMGAERACGGDINRNHIFGYYSKAWPLFGAYWLVLILTMLGFLLLLLPGIYLAVAYTFVAPLIADRKLGIWQAMETSRKIVSKSWFSYFGFFLLIALVNLIGAIPLGIGLIWTIPWSLCAIGTAYRDSFSYQERMLSA